ncbi:MAG: PilZ domain-containing protein [Proteobacteria bacterium]|nr:PilZ domain-containing protein [Pseudomonadota bacterium]MBU1233937.1 PilZ domain-containing protein [Pseudomonadota bacterium]MBU1419553.1 PilZ domain-containing protein [Pseudomonadota bacterium]MBU1456583.1 PilZ domain-containing protein [Pseudomonadota bacterium]
MDSSITDIVKKIIDSASAEIDISTTEGQTIRLKCIYKESLAPNFFLVFPPKHLPSNIDISRHCPISIKGENVSLTITAKILHINGDRTLELIAKKSVDPSSLREYFRVDTRMPIKLTYEPGPAEDRSHYWMLKGETLDLSGSGVLAILPDQPKSNHRIQIEITLKHTKTTIECAAHVIRSKRLRRGHYQVAFHFDHVSSKHRDSIISNCLQEQRMQLRERIQTSN